MTKACARHILVATEEQCLSLKQEIADGAMFADVAREHSTCPSGAQVSERMFSTPVVSRAPLLPSPKTTLGTASSSMRTT